MIKQFIKALTDKQESMVADAWRQHPYPVDF